MSINIDVEPTAEKGWVENRKTPQDTARRLEMGLTVELDLKITY